MSNKDEFGFDDFDIGYSDSDSSLDDLEVDGGFDDFTSNDNNDEDGKKNLIKTAVIMVAAGIAIIFIGILLSSLLNSAANKVDTDNNRTNVEHNVSKPSGDSGNQQGSNTPINNNVNSNSNGWVKFNATDSNVEFADDLMESTFTITDISHYVKRVDSSGNNISVRTVLTGNLSGFVGTYELELPYSKGQRLDIGTSFKVNVQYGVYGDRTVIGEIKY